MALGPVSCVKQIRDVVATLRPIPTTAPEITQSIDRSRGQ